ncbi:MAG TPA: hypothetical protein VMI54_12260 [Polyangiaceae bacterium]|nr:hypothetical protein [Polyangiaceae bacterium]
MPNSTQLFVIVAAAAVLVLIVGLFVARSARRRHSELVQRFGPEYERAVDELGSETRADKELLARERRVRGLHLRSLRDRERRQFTANWNQIQAFFFDDPAAAVQRADALIKAVMEARGYEPEHFEQRVADLSVEHASVVQHYRAARALATANVKRGATPDIDELRQAIVHYRALFLDLVSNPELARRHFWPGPQAPSRA